ncbi:uncharacterized protein LOC125237691 [Leguminivora glycinivorella]|uniref:uncharacterized protein LOC125237691 n=1 Tax=Leguminivora glycinivorella TaxID=1035111 RepID=UPI00200DB2DA|nr:uncharacterized protein LOC125237691 [Leguminivora glycinivorella]
MYRRVRRKMIYLIGAILLYSTVVIAKNIDFTDKPITTETDFDNNIIDFDSQYIDKDRKYGTVPWRDDYNKESNRYTIVNNDYININQNKAVTVKETTDATAKTTVSELDVIPLELVTTTENYLVSIVESTIEPDLTVIPLSTTEKVTPIVEVPQPVTLPSTQSPESTTEYFTTDNPEENFKSNKTSLEKIEERASTVNPVENVTANQTISIEGKEKEDINKTQTTVTSEILTTSEPITENTTIEILSTNSSKQSHINRSDEITEINDGLEFTTVNLDDGEVPEDYYDSKDVIPTKAPNTDVVSVLFGFAGSVVESVVGSVAERVVPKGIYDLFKRIQKQNEALEAERLRSREENGGLGQFGRGILKSISSGLSRPLSQLMAGARDIGSLDNDRGFVGSLASGVSSVANVANSVVDAFKDRVQAIYPGTLWCGDGHSAQARSSDLGLFFYTDTCCREHDACKIFILAGDSKYGLTNTGLFTRSHCSCDAKFRECLKKTNSLISAQIGLTYFNVLGPQCFRRAHPIVRCVRRTRLTGQKCEEYELDYTKPKMWQWFDNETF